MASSADLKAIFNAGRPLVEQALAVAEQIAALRDVATAKGLDWSQLKALLKAQVQDELDDNGEGKRVKRIVEKAEFASAYAGMLGLANMNENIIFAEDENPAALPPKSAAEIHEHDPETGEIEAVPVGFLAGLSAEQMAEALAYRGDENHGDEAFKINSPTITAPFVDGAGEPDAIAPLASGTNSASLNPSQVAAEAGGTAKPLPAVLPATNSEDDFVPPAFLTKAAAEVEAA